MFDYLSANAVMCMGIPQCMRYGIKETVAVARVMSTPGPLDPKPMLYATEIYGGRGWLGSVPKGTEGVIPSPHMLDVRGGIEDIFVVVISHSLSASGGASPQGSKGRSDSIWKGAKSEAT